MDDTLQKAIFLHRVGRLAEAGSLYRQILEQGNRLAEKAHALELLGLIACQEGRLEDAAELIGKAVALVPDNAEFWLNLGEVERRRGRIVESLAALRRAVEIAPLNAYAHYNLGVALRASSRHESAPGETLAAFRRALELAPGMAEAWNNLGLMLIETAADAVNPHAAAAEAILCYERLQALKPGHAEVENNLGRALWEANRTDEALAAFERAMALRGDFIAAHLNYAAGLRKLGRCAEALAAFRRIEALAPASPEIHRELGITLLETGQSQEAEISVRRAIDTGPAVAEAYKALGAILAARGKRAEACAAFEEALRLKETSGISADDWRFELAALRGESRQKAPEVFVRRLFDAYAPRFESHLVGELAYNVPKNLVTLIHEVAGRIGGIWGWDVMDLGCGTGLCGAAAAPYARHIVGIDLSPKMVEVARSRNIYDEVIQGDVAEILRKSEHTESLDVVLAGDLFTYVGDLRAVFTAVKAALRPLGVFAFSLEKEEGEGYKLHECARFAHSLSYLRSEIAHANLKEVVVREAVIRADTPPGWLVVLRRTR